MTHLGLMADVKVCEAEVSVADGEAEELVCVLASDTVARGVVHRYAGVLHLEVYPIDGPHLTTPREGAVAALLSSAREGGGARLCGRGDANPKTPLTS